MKKVLVYGLGISGISSVKALSSMGYDVYTYDKNKENIGELKGYKYSPISHEKIMDYPYDFVIKSPGIKPSDDLVVKLKGRYEIISDIEASFILFKDRKFMGLTGTNGKTTTTSMVTHILNESDSKAISVGNIGEGILWRMANDSESIFVEELSSFQLHDTKTYHPHIASIINITPDHLDWHGDYDDYINSKLKIGKNQTKDDFIIINHNDEILKKHKNAFSGNIYEFSSKNKVNKGIYLDDKNLIFTENGNDRFLLDVDDLKIIGKHNYENLMVAILMTYLYGVDLDDIVIASKSFKSISHRLEFVDEIDGVRIYNDSKATNVDSAIKAIDSFNSPLIMIAGGYDKKIDYTDYVKAFKKNGKLMIIMGETKDKLKDLCEDFDVPYKLANDMDDAINIAFKNAINKDVILLAPASASWDMYKSYEKRGEDFKEKINKYKGNLK